MTDCCLLCCFQYLGGHQGLIKRGQDHGSSQDVVTYNDPLYLADNNNNNNKQNVELLLFVLG
jgi:hypothetical protein